MVTKKSELNITEDGNLKKAYQKYRILKQEVDHWQQERKSYWLGMLNLAEKPPYLPIMELPSEAIIELWQRLNDAAEVKISDSDLREIWKQISDNQEVMDEEMSTRFQMAISGVAQLASEMANEKKVPTQRLGDDPHECITCPVCGEVSTLAVLTPPNGQRMMHCTSCSFEWPVKRVGCLHCGSENAKKQMFLKNAAFPGIEMVVCQLCGHYFKEIDARELYVQDYMWEDIKSLPLNFATELWLSEQTKTNNQIH
ncbi:MAG: formate dehydrogenase accessory protein FdhE [Syntrophomonadaceae bacterium]|nr:formate dehydrogenase accessory protein FdhE [Syntrophomonadaceae bacterium]